MALAWFPNRLLVCWCMLIPDACECQKLQVTLIGLNLLHKWKGYKSGLLVSICTANWYQIINIWFGWIRLIHTYELLPDHSGHVSWFYYDIYIDHVAGFCGSDQHLTSKRLLTFRPLWLPSFVLSLGLSGSHLHQDQSFLFLQDPPPTHSLVTYDISLQIIWKINFPSGPISMVWIVSSVGNWACPEHVLQEILQGFHLGLWPFLNPQLILCY